MKLMLLAAYFALLMPIPAPRLHFLYFWDDSYRGNRRDLVAGTVDATVIIEKLFRSPEDLDASFRDAIARHLYIAYAPNDNPGGGGQLQAPEIAARYWSQIVGMYLDEPTGNAAEVEAQLQHYYEPFRASGLSPKPWYVNFTSTQWHEYDGWKAPSIQATGIEAYADPTQQNDPNVRNATLARVRETIALAGQRDVFIVVQAYDRNGLWTNIESLRALQTVAYDAAAGNPRVTSIWFFNLDRGGGDTIGLSPCIRREHQRMWAAANDRVVLPSLACADFPR